MHRFRLDRTRPLFVIFHNDNAMFYVYYSSFLIIWANVIPLTLVTFFKLYGRFLGFLAEHLIGRPPSDMGRVGQFSLLKNDSVLLHPCISCYLLLIKLHGLIFIYCNISLANSSLTHILLLYYIP